MMRIASLVVALALGASASGCVSNYATREVSQGADPATLTVTNAPRGARIIVDGQVVGLVGDSQAGTSIATGRHEVVIEVDGRRIHSQYVFAMAGAKVEVRVP